MSSGIILTAVAITPLVVIPVTLVWGLRKALLGVVALAAVILVGIYAYFGIRALTEGEDLGAVFASLSIILPTFGTILGWVLVWSAAYGAIAAAVRLGWLHFRKGRA